MSESPVGQNRVANAIWPWRETALQSAKTASHGNVKGRALLQALIMAAIAGLFLYRHHRIPSAVLAVLAGLVLTSGCLVPSFFLAFEKAGRKFGQWVAIGVTWLLLVPFYYLCFVPGRIVILLTGKDPLNRRFPSPSATLWVPRPPVKDPAQYRKQF